MKLSRPHGLRYFATETLKGKVFDKRPFKCVIEAGKIYKWCACGHSANQSLVGTNESKWGEPLEYLDCISCS
ncbi:unnamed protein product [Darwinula stevensoni]|uniref:Uncharacterized protein n=1 Tax=Darwinula stevensoni TaxID=69355 RepID=A0A7R9AE40_9CRUS|nr:unnamed protein product [Darwinula stevensoni]CAG0901616.1 unnamed protein product [Darwinula stevensoni]